MYSPYTFRNSCFSFPINNFIRCFSHTAKTKSRTHFFCQFFTNRISCKCMPEKFTTWAWRKCRVFRPRIQAVSLSVTYRSSNQAGYFQLLSLDYLMENRTSQRNRYVCECRTISQIWSIRLSVIQNFFVCRLNCLSDCNSVAKFPNRIMTACWWGLVLLSVQLDSCHGYSVYIDNFIQQL